MDDEVDAPAIQRGVVPERLEAQDLPVVQQELRLLLVGWGLPHHELGHHLGVHGLVGRRQAALLCGLLELVTLLPQVLLQRLILAHVDVVVGVEPPREAVAACDVVHPAVELDVLPTAKVVRPDEALAVRAGDAVALEELALRHARVLHLGLRHGQRSVLHVIHEGELAVAAVLVRTLRHVLLVEPVETQHLLVVLDPRGRHSEGFHVLRQHVVDGGGGLRLGHLGGLPLAPPGVAELLGGGDGLGRGARPLHEVHGAAVAQAEGERVLAGERAVDAPRRAVRADHHEAGQGAGLPHRHASG
mmetsp:Transcript_56490/g.172018  ORF Transcript_56490/g.172018 Transcript_56490/m.172018 type:complete len:302 (-) Transcript_56490:77-982(-)